MQRPLLRMSGPQLRLGARLSSQQFSGIKVNWVVYPSSRRYTSPACIRGRSQQRPTSNLTVSTLQIAVPSLRLWAPATLRWQQTSTSAPKPQYTPKTQSTSTSSTSAPKPQYTPRTPTTQPVSTSSTSAAKPQFASSPQAPPPTPSSSAEIETQDLSDGLNDAPLVLDPAEQSEDWTRSFHGLSAEPFSKEAAAILMQPIPPEDIEIKHDGIVYMPEIKYRRILNKAFGPGGWGLAPRGETIVTPKSVTREYALVAHGRLVSVARGEQDYFAPEGIPTAVEGCKSNALTRCCKDLGIASELWDPRYTRKFLAQHAREVFVEHVPTKKRKKVWLRKDDQVKYPYKET